MSIGSYKKTVLLSTFVGFDNTPRYKRRAKIVQNLKPEILRQHLENISRITRTSNRTASENIIFINAWNEWGEGMMLEPSEWYGSSLINAVKNLESQV